jgi:type I restriction enzyme S subunit
MSDVWVRTTFGKIAQRRTEIWNPGDPEAIYIGLEHISPYELRLLGTGVSTAVSSNKTRFLAHDVLFGKLRPYFQKVVRPPFPGVCSTDIWALYPSDESQVDPGFLHWIVADPAFSDFANSAETGTRMPRASWQWVSTYELALPPLEEQRRIAEVLGALDDRIEVSRSLIEALAASIQLEAAAVVQSAGEATQLLTDVATIVNGYSYKSSELVEDSDTAMVNLKNFGRHGGFRLDGLKPFDGTPKPTQMLVSGDAMVAKTDLTQGAEVIGRCLRMPDLPQFDRYVASLDIAIVRSKGQLPQLTLCALLAQPEFRDHCLGFVSGTTVLHMSKAALETYTLPVLDTGRVAALTTRVDALAAQQDRTLIELYHLQQMRDFLLPRLVSGELRVAAAEDLVEAAT